MNKILTKEQAMNFISNGDDSVSRVLNTNGLNVVSKIVKLIDFNDVIKQAESLINKNNDYYEITLAYGNKKIVLNNSHFNWVM